MSEGLTYLITLGIIYLAGRWFLSRNVGNEIKANYFKYALYGFCGLGIVIVVAGLVMAVIANSVSYSEFHLLGVWGLIGMFVLGVGGFVLGIFIARKSHATLEISPATQQQLENLAKAQADAKKIPKDQAALLQGLVLVIVGALMLLLNHFSNFDNLQDPNMGAPVPGWLLRDIFYLALVVGVCDIFYALALRIKKSFSKQKSA